MDPTFAPNKAEGWRALSPCNAVASENGASSDPREMPEFFWVEAGVSWVEAVLHNDVPALQHLHAQVARAHEDVASAKTKLAELVPKILETPAEQRPCLVAQIQSLVAQIGQDNSWGHSCQTFAQWRFEAIVRCLTPHAEAGAMAKAYRHFSETHGWVAGGVTSGKNRRERGRSRDEQIYQEYTQDRPTGQRAMAAKKDALARKYGLKTRRQVGRILAQETARKAGEPA